MTELHETYVYNSHESIQSFSFQLRNNFITNSRLHLNVEDSNSLEIYQAQNFNRQQFSNIYVEGKNATKLILSMKNFSSKNTVQEIQKTLNDLLQTINIDFKTVYFESITNAIDISFLTDIKFTSGIQCIGLDFTVLFSQHISNFENKMNVKQLNLRCIPRGFSLAGMPYFEEISFSEKQSCQQLKDELDKCFDKVGNVYKMKKQFVVNGHLKTDINESYIFENNSDINNINYIALKLDKASKNKLIDLTRKIFGNKYGKIYCDHITIAYGYDQIQKFDMDLLGKSVWIDMWNIIYDNKACAALVSIDYVKQFNVNNKYPHITMACDNYIKPVYSNVLISDYFQTISDAAYIQLDQPIELKATVELILKN